jgi:hypothetical protein
MKKEGSNNIALIFKDESDEALDHSSQNFLNKACENKDTKIIKEEAIITSNLSISKISPVIILEKNKSLKYPKVKVTIDELDQIVSSQRNINIEQDLKNIQNKFDPKKSEENMKDEIDKDENSNDDDKHIKLLEPEDEEDPRKNLDKYNLFKGFVYAFDPFNTRSHLENEDDVDNFDVNFDTMENRLKEMFGIKI